MGSFSDYLENELLDHVFGGADYSRPATVYVAAYTATPSDSGGGTEVSGTNYARVAVTNNGTNFPASSGGAKSNGTAITFAQAGSGGWGTVTAIGIFDASTSGNLLAWDDFTGITIAENDTLEIAIGDLDLSLT